MDGVPDTPAAPLLIPTYSSKPAVESTNSNVNTLTTSIKATSISSNTSATTTAESNKEFDTSSSGTGNLFKNAMKNFNKGNESKTGFVNGKKVKEPIIPIEPPKPPENWNDYLWDPTTYALPHSRVNNIPISLLPPPPDPEQHGKSKGNVSYKVSNANSVPTSLLIFSCILEPGQGNKNQLTINCNAVTISPTMIYVSYIPVESKIKCKLYVNEQLAKGDIQVPANLYDILLSVSEHWMTGIFIDVLCMPASNHTPAQLLNYTGRLIAEHWMWSSICTCNDFFVCQSYYENGKVFQDLLLGMLLQPFRTPVFIIERLQASVRDCFSAIFDYHEFYSIAIRQSFFDETEVAQMEKICNEKVIDLLLMLEQWEKSTPCLVIGYFRFHSEPLKYKFSSSFVDDRPKTISVILEDALSSHVSKFDISLSHVNHVNADSLDSPRLHLEPSVSSLIDILDFIHKGLQGYAILMDMTKCSQFDARVILGRLEAAYSSTIVTTETDRKKLLFGAFNYLTKATILAPNFNGVMHSNLRSIQCKNTVYHESFSSHMYHSSPLLIYSLDCPLGLSTTHELSIYEFTPIIAVPTSQDSSSSDGGDTVPDGAKIKDSSINIPLKGVIAYATWFTDINNHKRLQVTVCLLEDRKPMIRSSGRVYSDNPKDESSQSIVYLLSDLYADVLQLLSTASELLLTTYIPPPVTTAKKALKPTEKALGGDSKGSIKAPNAPPPPPPPPPPKGLNDSSSVPPPPPPPPSRITSSIPTVKPKPRVVVENKQLQAFVTALTTSNSIMIPKLKEQIIVKREIKTTGRKANNIYITEKRDLWEALLKMEFIDVLGLFQVTGVAPITI